MTTFKDLDRGDMFNTMVARWVKITDNEAIVVGSGLLEIGSFETMNPDLEVIILYTGNPKLKDK